MLMHNRLEYLTPLFERRSEIMVPGNNFVTQHLNGLGFQKMTVNLNLFSSSGSHQIFQHCFRIEHYQVMPSACD